MAFEIPVLDLSMTADSDYSGVGTAVNGQYLNVKITGVKKIGTCSATTDTILGIMQNKPGSLQAAAVRVYGVSKLVADGAITAGSLVCTAANAKGTVVASGSATIYTIGISLDTAASQNGVASVFITHAGRGA